MFADGQLNLYDNRQNEEGHEMNLAFQYVFFLRAFSIHWAKEPFIS